MNNTDKKNVINLNQKFFNALGNIFEKIAENTTSSCGAYFAYEPDYPKELLENIKEKG